MELILINDSKLKIMLTPSDMKEYDISCESVDYKKTETRRAFWCILDDAKHKTGFDAASEKVYIQMYPSKEGGCEMYVTKLELKSSKESHHALLPLSRRFLAFSFERLDELIGVCRRLRAIDFSGSSEAHRSNTGRYVLIIDEPEENAYIGLSEHSFIDEFGRRENVKHVKLMCHEHASCICGENAVEILGSL